jgi:glycerophosphoryl diester phosphodiesterase
MSRSTCALIAVALLLAACDEPRETPEFVQWLPDHPIVAAHRGGAHLAPENTIRAFEVAQEPGIEAELIELDMHRSDDGQLVVIHDRSVDRVTGQGNGCATEQDTEEETFGELLVGEMTVAELQELDAGYCFEDEDGAFPYRDAGVTIPTLAEVLLRFPGQRFVLEVKDHDPETATLLLALLEQMDAFDRTCILDFDDEFIDELGSQAPDEACIAMPSSGIRCWATAEIFPFGGGGCPAWDLMWMPEDNSGFDLKKESLVRDLHAAGLPVFMWTVNDVETMETIVDIGADGVVTDRPDLLREVIGTPGVGVE